MFELSGSTRLRVLSLLVMDWDMFHRLKFLSVLLWLYLLTWFLQEVYDRESHDPGGIEHSLCGRLKILPWATACQEWRAVPAANVGMLRWTVGTSQLTSPTSVEYLRSLYRF